MRTEEQILKDFEKLGYKRNENNSEDLIWLEREYTNYIVILEINKKFLSYCKYDICKENCIESPIGIRMHEHKLLHELFELWEWL